jgi:hypothetical protein
MPFTENVLGEPCPYEVINHMAYPSEGAGGIACGEVRKVSK